MPAIAARVRRWFDLDVDPRPITALLGADPFLTPLVAARPGLRVPGAWDGFEVAVRAVLGQQITVTAARGLARRFVAHYGQRFAATATDVGGLTHVFPSAGQVAGADLSSLGVPRARAEALGRRAVIAASEPGLLDSHPETAETVTRRRAIRGVGQWTADYIAMRALRDPDAFPAGDVGLQRALAADNGRRASFREALFRAERWRRWRAHAAQHLWTALARRANSSSI